MVLKKRRSVDGERIDEKDKVEQELHDEEGAGERNVQSKGKRVKPAPLTRMGEGSRWRRGWQVRAIPQSIIYLALRESSIIQPSGGKLKDGPETRLSGSPRQPGV